MFKVAIIGRPNVGKSTLFNRLHQSRRAIVGNEPGMTRDRLYATVEWRGKNFEVIDTGGMIPREEELITSKIFAQAAAAITESDLILFLVDARAGVTPLDQELAEYLRSQQKKVFLVVNKVDLPKLAEEAHQFYEFGWDSVYAISAEHGLGVAELLEAITSRMPEPEAEPEKEEEPRAINLAIVGRPNVGKSLLVNRLIGHERVIVSELPGTTRDAIDTLIVHQGQTFRIIDTAGIRRKGRTTALAEKLSVIMARKHLRRADVALIVMDSVEGPTKLDATIAGYAHEAGCSIILLLNKWDVIERGTGTAKEYTKKVRFRMKFLEYAPVITVSALKGIRVVKLFDLVQEAAEARRRRVPTSVLNEFFNSHLKARVLTANPKRKFEVKYITQIKDSPPTFVLFMATRDKLHFSMERFIINNLREHFGFFATPLRLIQRGKKGPRKS